MTQYRIKYPDGTVTAWRDYLTLAIIDQLTNEDYFINEGDVEMRANRGGDDGEKIIKR